MKPGKSVKLNSRDFFRPKLALNCLLLMGDLLGDLLSDLELAVGTNSAPSFRRVQSSESLLLRRPLTIGKVSLFGDGLLLRCNSTTSLALLRSLRILGTRKLRSLGGTSHCEGLAEEYLGVVQGVTEVDL